MSSGTVPLTKGSAEMMLHYDAAGMMFVIRIFYAKTASVQMLAVSSFVRSVSLFSGKNALGSLEYGFHMLLRPTAKVLLEGPLFAEGGRASFCHSDEDRVVRQRNVVKICTVLS